MFALNLAEDGRILSATYQQFAQINAVIVEELPNGNISDYRYVDGKYVYDPLIEPEQNLKFPVAPRNITESEYFTVDGVMYRATSNIPNGEPIITGQNAVTTTIEEQLAELAKGE